jgi:hypothetical protein
MNAVSGLSPVDLNYVVTPGVTRVAYYNKLQELNATTADCGATVTELIKYVHNTALDSFVKLESKLQTGFLEIFKVLFNQTVEPTITNMNLISLQYIILFTEIEKRKQGKDTKTIMSKYPVDRIIVQYDSLFKLVDYSKKPAKKYDWTNMNDLRVIIQNLAKDSNEYARLLDVTCGKPNTCIIVLLGEMTFEELLISMISRIHYIGCSFTMEWADGNYYTPFEFMHHDLIHITNFVYRAGVDLSNYDILSSDFIKFLKENYSSSNTVKITDISGKDVTISPILDDYLYIIFIIAHETYDVHYLERYSNLPTDAFNIPFKYSGLNTRLQNKHNLGGYIESRGVPLESMKNNERKTYINFILQNLILLVKKFRDDKNKRNKEPASVTGSTSNAAGGARKTRRRRYGKKHTKRRARK